MKKIFFIIAIFCSIHAFAQVTPDKHIRVNENVTTHITVSEPIKYVDISTENIVGDIPIDNILRIKPVFQDDSLKFKDYESLAIVTIVTEKHKLQLKAFYTVDETNAFSDLNYTSLDMKSYMNPDVSMSQTDMFKYSWQIFNSKKKFYDVTKEQYKLRINLRNLYTIGDYFFIDLAIENKTKIKFDVDQIRFKIEDKKQTKATNFQSIEIQPVLSLTSQKFFQKEYRNIFVFKKFTFPDEKVFVVEISEEQISGRNVSLKIDYQDVLNADSFSKNFKNYY